MFTIRKKNNPRDEQLRQLLSGKRIPILVLDEKWYGLFPEELKSPRIKKGEKELKDLLKKQGEMNNDIKNMKKEKNILMKDIVKNMEVEDSNQEKERSKKVSDSKKRISEINKKVEEYEALLENDIPKEIERANMELAIHSMNDCYERMLSNNDVINETAQWINKMREELKQRIIIKQEKEISNSDIYTYMHNILGPDIMELFDGNNADIIAKLDKKQKEDDNKNNKE